MTDVPMTDVPATQAHRDEARAATRADRAVGVWLFVMTGLVLAMILVGGLTRLTDSGLSITEWEPIRGVIPPLTDAQWQLELEKYRQIAEYQLQNRGMSMAEFQVIYWWEWAHRLLGRVVGLAMLIPLVVFWALGALRGYLKPRLVVLFALGGLQGFVGWWMVASGVGESSLVDVSPYRLAVHKAMALVILAGLFWAALDAWAGPRRVTRGHALAWAGAGLATLIGVQSVLGAFVAGLNAGVVYTDWPLMNGDLVAASYGALEPWWRNAFENPAAAQLHHRIGGYLVALAGIAAGLWALRQRAGVPGRTALIAVAVLCVGQMGLGILTLMSAAALPLAASHQLLGAGLLLAALAAAHGAFSGKGSQRDR